MSAVVRVTLTRLLLMALPTGSLKKQPVEVAGVLARGGTTEHVVVNAAVREILLRQHNLVIILALPAGSLKKPLVALVAELASVGLMKLVAVKDRRILGTTHPRVTALVLRINTGMALLV